MIVWVCVYISSKRAERSSNNNNQQPTYATGNFEPFFICKIRIVISFRFIYFGPWILQPVIILWNKTEILAQQKKKLQQMDPAIFNRASNRAKDTFNIYTPKGTRGFEIIWPFLRLLAINFLCICFIHRNMLSLLH